MKVYSNNSLPIKCWASDLENEALEQANNLANLPFAFRHIAIMPDAHMGYGMPIGGVMATKGVIVPNAVGVDIGCGMAAARSNVKVISVEQIKKVMGIIRKLVPVGFSHQTSEQSWAGFDCAPDIDVVSKQLTPAKRQLGTLGGGNHFIEIQKDEDNCIWIMIHSGSRNFGYKIANHYHETAKNKCELWHSEIPTLDLAFLPVDSKEGQDYLASMNFALSFAKANRNLMMLHCMTALREVFRGREIAFDYTLDVHHNYAAIENHFGQNVWVHRKGATSARAQQPGIIPGSQGTKSYIVEGLGNPESFTSCSHGAGRKMGRKAAQRNLNLEEQKKLLDDQGVVHAIRNAKDLDEAPGAYKDIDEVMENQQDLVKIVHTLTPLGVIKG